MKIIVPILALIIVTQNTTAQKRARDFGISFGVMQPGKMNAITDVSGVKVGHVTLIKADSVRTGVTVIVPTDGNLFQNKIPAAVYVGNGFGKLAGSTQVNELGNLETPIVLTNTLSVATAMNALIGYTIQLPGNENVASVNPLVGETNDGYLNDIRGRHVRESDVLEAISIASAGPVEEGNIGAGTGTVCFGFKGGIGTSSRKLPESLGGFTIGVLVQTNFGGVLSVDGIPVGKEMKKFNFSNQLLNNVDGSCMIVVATDAPLDFRNLERLAKRAMLGIGRTGGIASNGSGDYVIAFSTAAGIRVPFDIQKPASGTQPGATAFLHNDRMSPLFMAVIEATEEAIINSLFIAKPMKGRNGNAVENLPIDEVMRMWNKQRK